MSPSPHTKKLIQISNWEFKKKTNVTLETCWYVLWKLQLQKTYKQTYSTFLRKSLQSRSIPTTKRSSAMIPIQELTRSPTFPWATFPLRRLTFPRKTSRSVRSFARWTSRIDLLDGGMKNVKAWGFLVQSEGKGMIQKTHFKIGSKSECNIISWENELGCILFRKII